VPTSKDRPRAWNDDVLWLLAKIAGLTAGQGAGTGSGTLPRGIGSDAVLHYARADFASLDASGELAIQLPETTRSWVLVALTLHRTTGSATTFAPRLGQSASFAADGPDDRVGYSAQAVGTPIRSVFCEAIPFRADSDFRIYLRPGFDSGSDNGGTYQVWIREAIETEESAP
jgi:hypothetical protein